MPVKFEKTMDGNSVFFTVTGRNNRILCTGFGYNNNANAKKGARAALKELAAWAEREDADKADMAEYEWHKAGGYVPKTTKKKPKKKKRKMDGDYNSLYPRG